MRRYRDGEMVSWIVTMMNRGAVFDRLEMLINICDNFRLRWIWELP